MRPKTHVENNSLGQRAQLWKGIRRSKEMAYFKIQLRYTHQLKQELKMIQSLFRDLEKNKISKGGAL